MSDNVYHPNHYVVNAVKLEPIELTGRLPSLVGQAVNYVMRARHKGSFSEDLKKAINCLIIQMNMADAFSTAKVLCLQGGYTRTMMEIFRKHYKPQVADDGLGNFEAVFLRTLITENLQITQESIGEAVKVLEDVYDDCYVP